ncbi:chaperone protein dnaJ 11, chloroplastic-like [Cornus florida]|uniref:chaperone protein dnaJ 11, chloroplastic-like n=1 Tax=Cornus florida TaxID=4283 RepID=UPI00289BAD74|nr:chaperone protein dnaJ 11, chloroplastic-like [Cornus florida]
MNSMFVSSSNSLFVSSLPLGGTKISLDRRSSNPSSVRFRPVKIVAATATTSVCFDMASCSSLYDVLGIPVSASGHEIKAAYRRLARTCHPDVASMNQKEWSANEFMKIHAAYSTLSDPEKRAHYDRDLFRVGRGLGSFSAMPAASWKSSESAYSGFTRRNWETDQCW